MSIQNAYDQWSEIYDTNQNLTRDLDQMLTCNTFAGQHFDSILETGCGTGKNTIFLADIGAKVHALDFSSGMIEKAREKVKSKNVRFSTADLTKQWPCDDAEYDLVTCNLVLEHIQDLNHIFAEASRTLKSMGRFFINELHPFRQYLGKKARFEKGGKITEVDVFVHHISDFTNSAVQHGLVLVKFGEHWHKADKNKPPRIASFLFAKASNFLTKFLPSK